MHKLIPTNNLPTGTYQDAKHLVLLRSIAPPVPYPHFRDEPYLLGGIRTPY